MTDRMERILDIAKILLTKVKEKYETQANKHRLDIPWYKINDQIWLNSTNIKTQKPSPKLSDIWLGPYKVLDIQNHSCILELDFGSRFCKTFHNSLFWSIIATGLPGQEQTNNPRNTGLVFIRDDDEEEVEEWKFDCIFDSRQNDRLEYLIQWIHHILIWQPTPDLKGYTSDLEDFYKLFPEKLRSKQRRPLKVHFLLTWESFEDKWQFWDGILSQYWNIQAAHGSLWHSRQLHPPHLRPWLAAARTYT